MSLEQDFALLRAELLALETRYEELVREGKEKDAELERLRACKVEGDFIWLSGPNRHQILAQLLGPDRATQVGDGAFPFTIDTKYFTASVHIHCHQETRAPNTNAHAMILAFDGPIDLTLAQDFFSANEDAEVKLCVTGSDDGDWCVENEVEHVPSAESELRVREALSSTMWPNAVVKPRPIITKPLVPLKRKPTTTAEASLDEFERILAQAKQVKEQASFETNDEQRRARAAQAAMQMLQFLDDEDDSDD